MENEGKVEKLIKNVICLSIKNQMHNVRAQMAAQRKKWYSKKIGVLFGGLLDGVGGQRWKS